MSCVGGQEPGRIGGGPPCQVYSSHYLGNITKRFQFSEQNPLEGPGIKLCVQLDKFMIAADFL